MSTQLPTIDLSTAVVGTTGTINLSFCAPTSNPAYTTKPAVLQLYNESGCGLRMSYRETGGGTDIAAGVWKNLIIPAGEHFVDYVVQYVIPAARVNTILGNYYPPNEAADAVGTLGNSPGTVANQVGTGLSFNAVLECFPSLNMPSPQGPQTVTLSSQHLNISTVSTSKPAYLVLGYLFAEDQNLFKKNQRMNKEHQAAINVPTIPNGGGVQTFLFAPANWFTSITLSGFVPNVSVTKVRVKRSQDAVGAFLDLVTGTLTASTNINLTNFFGSEGMPNLVSQAGSSGFSVEITFTNSTGVNQGLFCQFSGQQIAYDEALWYVSYQDWQSNLYDLGTIRHGQDFIFPLNLLIPIAITNPAQSNFGSLVFQLVGSQLFYDTADLWGLFIPCTTTFLTP